MNGVGPSTSGVSRLWQAVLVLLAAALAARLVWELLAPLVPVLLATGIGLLLYGWLRRGHY